MRFLYNEFVEHEESTIERNYEALYQVSESQYLLNILDTSGNEFFFDTMYEKVKEFSIFIKG